MARRDYAGMLNPHAISAIKQATFLPDLIAGYLPIKKLGQKYIGLCPFHREKTPSFSVWNDHYHCFGCGANGDAFAFIQAIECVSFGEAGERLARAAGVSLGKPITRAASVYAQEEASFCKWWWERRLEELNAVLSEAVLSEACYGEDREFRDCVSRIYRHARNLPIPERFAMFRRQATGEDRQAYKNHIENENAWACIALLWVLGYWRTFSHAPRP